MKLTYRQRGVLASVIAALAAGAVIVATIRGSGQTVMLVVLVVALLAAYAVRHHVRARVLYRQTDCPEATPRSVAEVAAADPAVPGAHHHRGDQDDHNQRRERQVS